MSNQKLPSHVEKLGKARALAETYAAARWAKNNLVAVQGNHAKHRFEFRGRP